MAAATGRALDASQFMVWRPFYFANLIVDPKDENKVFKAGGSLLLSTDGGHSFGAVSGGAHGDFHDVWIDPAHTDTVFAGDDGGLWRSHDGGTRWEHMMNLPVSQFYHVSVDNAEPYHVYGGLQDNSSWVGDSSYPGGVSNSRWENMFGGDGFWTWEDPVRPRLTFTPKRRAAKSAASIASRTRPAPSSPTRSTARRSCASTGTRPIQMSPNEKGTIYIGAQFLFRSRDHGQSWERISPDLTTNDPEKQKQEESGGITVDNSAAEMNTTIYSISESPRNGQHDLGGHRRWQRAGHARWRQDVDQRRRQCQRRRQGAVGLVGGGRPLRRGHRLRDLRPPHVRRHEAVRSTRPPTTARPGPRCPCSRRACAATRTSSRKTRVNPNLLFLGTEFGLWISIDGGQRWAQYKGTDFPAVAVRDLVVHPRTCDLVLATHGRGIWIIDDIAPWRALTDAAARREDAGFLPGARRPCSGWRPSAAGPEGDATFSGPSRSTEAFIPYYQRSRHILRRSQDRDSRCAGQAGGYGCHQQAPRREPRHVVDAPEAAARAAGRHRGVRRRRRPARSARRLHRKMTRGDKVYTTQLTVALDPRAKFTVEDRKAQFDLVNQARRAAQSHERSRGCHPRRARRRAAARIETARGRPAAP